METVWNNENDMGLWSVLRKPTEMKNRSWTLKSSVFQAIPFIGLFKHDRRKYYMCTGTDRSIFAFSPFLWLYGLIPIYILFLVLWSHVY